MANKKLISDYTESEFLDYMKNLYDFSGRSEADGNRLVHEFEELTEHPDGFDLIFYPRNDREDSPEGIVQEVKEWRAVNRKSGFKSE